MFQFEYVLYVFQTDRQALEHGVSSSPSPSTSAQPPAKRSAKAWCPKV